MNPSSEASARWAATMVAVAPTLVAKSQRSRSVRAMVLPYPTQKYRQSSYYHRVIPDTLGTTLRTSD
jgi:hypothetical protein